MHYHAGAWERVKNYHTYGHGVAYYRDKGMRYKEVFANLFYLRGTKHWGYVVENFPNLSKRFVEIIDKGIE